MEGQNILPKEIINTHFEWVSSFPSWAPETTYALANACISNHNTQRIFVHTPFPVPADCHYFQLAEPYNGPGFEAGSVLILSGTGGTIFVNGIFDENPQQNMILLKASMVQPIAITGQHIVDEEDCEPIHCLDRLAQRPELPMTRVQLAVPLELWKYTPEQKMSLKSLNVFLFSGLYNDIMPTHFNPAKTRRRREQLRKLVQTPVPKMAWGLATLTSAFKREGHVRGSNHSSPASSCGTLSKGGITVHQEVEYHSDYTREVESSGMVSGC